MARRLSYTEPPVISRLSIGEAFRKLEPRHKLYAHHLSRAAWSGARIVLRQVSPESNYIFDFIVAVHQSCNGNWEALLDRTNDSDKARAELKNFLLYSAVFLSNLGNYYGEGDQKFVPDVSSDFMMAISSGSEALKELCYACLQPMLSNEPEKLSYPSETTQSAYYPGPSVITPDEIAQISKLMSKDALGERNTRIAKNQQSWFFFGVQSQFHVLQASIEKDDRSPIIGRLKSGEVRLLRGDHSDDLRNVNKHLFAAAEFADTKLRKLTLEKYQLYFCTGDLAHDTEAQKFWVQDKHPPVETYFGFIETYRDPFGTRAEFEGFVAIPDTEHSQILQSLVDDAEKYIATLPWVAGAHHHDDNINGPFELDKYIAPEFQALHALTYCSTNLFLGLNLPANQEVRDSFGQKIFMVRNRDQSLDSEAPSVAEPGPFIAPNERLRYLQHIDASVTFKVTLHELFGHGTGKLLMEDPSGGFNFDPEHPPISPLSGKPIVSWYKPGQNLHTVFGAMAMALEECRAECVGAILALERNILATFGYTDQTPVTANELVYNLYLAFGELGLAGLESYSPLDKRWSQAHDRARFAIMQVLLRNGGFMQLAVDKDDRTITVSIDGSRIKTHAVKEITKLLLRLHIYICTADLQAAEAYFGSLTEVEGEWLDIREIVLEHMRQEPARIFVQANTSLGDDGEVILKEYDMTVEGIIQSWVDRNI